MKCKSRVILVMVLMSAACAFSIFYLIFLDREPNLLILFPLLITAIVSAYFWTRYFIKEINRRG